MFKQRGKKECYCGSKGLDHVHTQKKPDMESDLVMQPNRNAQICLTAMKMYTEWIILCFWETAHLPLP